jgi:eukaryotic-like serine/threonine-protein kinase
MAQEPHHDHRDLHAFEGRTLQGTYLLRTHLGEGNFGAVFLSEQRFLGVPVRRVAVKLSKHVGMDVDTARSVFADAFLLAEAMDQMTDAEARSHLVHVYDVGLAKDADNRGFLVMEFVEGTTLQAQFRSYTRVPAPLLVKWARQICLAMKGLHALSPPVLHRDLKPDNVLLGLDRSVRVVDFGLAAKLVNLGFVPGVAGTTAYMAPETMRGASMPASDVYSIGLMLYEGLTGRLPFSHLIAPGDLPKELHLDWLHDARRALVVAPPSTLNATVPRHLDPIVLRSLAFAPHERFQNAGELLEALTAGAPAASAGSDALGEGQRLRRDANPQGAREALERALGAAGVPRDERYALLVELGTVLDELGNHLDAAGRLAEAWNLARDTTVLRSRAERAALLDRIAETYRRAGNQYQALRYATAADAERQGIARA